MAYDIIGDIHGYADKLTSLLRKLGYRSRSGVWRHPEGERQVVFLGDFIDRGPQQLETLGIVRRMIDEGSAQAVMGNHEFNAVAWHSPDPLNPGDFLRSHKLKKNMNQHRAFLKQVGGDANRHRELVDWFLTLPLWLDFPELRVVHACWHQPYMDFLRSSLSPGLLMNSEIMEEASRKDTRNDPREFGGELSIYNAVDVILKGLEYPLPGGMSFSDKGGLSRIRSRIRWWDRSAEDLPSAFIGIPEDVLKTIPSEPLPEDLLIPFISRKDSRPVFFGHYWLSGTPSIQSENAVCLDYSVALGGCLAAYRWDGESRLDSGKLVWV